MDRGFIKLFRKIADNPLWNKKPFSDGQAWVDLLLIANHKPRVIDKRGNRVKVDRGQVGVSVKGLSDRWGWSQGKVNRFLDFLMDEEQIGVQKSNVTTLITLVNFETYAKTESKTESRQRTDGEQAETNKKGKKGKKEPLTTHGENGQVKLSQRQIDSLLAKMDKVEMEFWIQKVDNYCELHGKKYSNYSLAVQNFRTRNPGEYSSVAELVQPVVPNSSTQDEADRIKREYNL